MTNIFLELGYSEQVSKILSELCTLNESLPQGAPTSPALSNLVVTKLDEKLGEYALNEKIRYTRYADDLTFSGKFSAGRLINFVHDVVTSEGFKLNETKTRLMERHQRQEVTGVVVNEKLHVARDKRRRFRQEIYYIEKYGLSSHMNYLNLTKRNYVKHLIGIATFLIFINPDDKEAQMALELLYKHLES